MNAQLPKCSQVSGHFPFLVHHFRTHCIRVAPAVRRTEMRTLLIETLRSKVAREALSGVGIFVEVEHALRCHTRNQCSHVQQRINSTGSQQVSMAGPRHHTLELDVMQVICAFIKCFYLRFDSCRQLAIQALRSKLRSRKMVVIS